MKLVIDGNAAAGTIEMGGFDYHTGDRMTGEARDFNLGNCIGACLEYAARAAKPVMIYVFSDGSLSSSGMIDSSVGGRGKGVWTGDNQNVAATRFLVFDPRASRCRRKPPEVQPANRNLQFARRLAPTRQAAPRATTYSTWCRWWCSTTSLARAGAQTAFANLASVANQTTPWAQVRRWSR